MGLGLSRNNAESAPGPVFSVAGRLYRFLDPIGQGSEATVYRCEDQNALQHAVKVMDFARYSPTEVNQRVRKFDKEARLLKYMSKRSQHFLHLLGHEYKPMENTGYMVIELGQGNLRQFLVGTPMDDVHRRMLWKQIVTILKDLQKARVVHADIKPDNMIMVNNVMKVTDLGLAFRILSTRHAAQRPRVRGTLDYMAPEVFMHRTGFKSDIWSAGIILYEMTYGRPPFYDVVDRDQKILAITSMQPLAFPPVRDPYLLDCMKRCLQYDPRLRPDAYQLQAHPYSRM